MGDAEEQEWEWDWGRRLHSLQPSPRGQSLQGQAAGGKQQPRGAVPAPGPLGAAAGLSTNVRLKRAMALVPQAAAAMGIADPAEFFLHRLEQIWEAPNKGRDGLALYSNTRWADPERARPARGGRCLARSPAPGLPLRTPSAPGACFLPLLPFSTEPTCH